MDQAPARFLNTANKVLEVDWTTDQKFSDPTHLFYGDFLRRPDPLFSVVSTEGPRFQYLKEPDQSPFALPFALLRRSTMKICLTLSFQLLAFLLAMPSLIGFDGRPNVVVMMSDDQGVGDYGFMGNSVIRTPALDAMAARGTVMDRFYVSPVCAPTRASLMTGRYNYRTRCIDTYIGRAMMDTKEITLAEFLRDAGYRTGIFGKWHLGDNYPLRAMDQGFQESLVHRGGGIGQPSDPIGAEGKYTDPTLIRNGVEVPMKGYCTDIYFDAAMDFISTSVANDRNFFTYIATNAPHGPFHDVPTDLYAEYLETDFRPVLLNKNMPEKRYLGQKDKLARIAAMITNIDENVDRLFKKLDELGITDNTIVMYLNDNGPNTMRFVGDMRGMKTHVDDGGIRSPLVVHWPASVAAGKRASAFAAHIDLLPTLLDACEVQIPPSHKIDGQSLLPILKGEKATLGERSVVFQSHRGNVPQALHHFALHRGPWKLVHPSGFGKESIEGKTRLELYNLESDPQQKVDLAAQKPDKLKQLKKEYEAWFQDVSSSRSDNYAPPRIVVGTNHEPVSVLTRQDWRHTQGKRPWSPDSNGFWLIETLEPHDFRAEIILKGNHPAGTANVRVGDFVKSLRIDENKNRGYFVDLRLPTGEHQLNVDVEFSGSAQGPHQVILARQ